MSKKKLMKIVIWGYGEIGKHAGLKNQCRKASRFDSGYPYQTLQIKVDKDFRKLFVLNHFVFAPARVTFPEEGIIVLNCKPHLPSFLVEVNIPTAEA